MRVFFVFNPRASAKSAKIRFPFVAPKLEGQHDTTDATRHPRRHPPPPNSFTTTQTTHKSYAAALNANSQTPTDLSPKMSFATPATGDRRHDRHSHNNLSYAT